MSQNPRAPRDITFATSICPKEALTVQSPHFLPGVYLLYTLEAHGRVLGSRSSITSLDVPETAPAFIT